MERRITSSIIVRCVFHRVFIHTQPCFVLFSDYRLNPQLQRACKADIGKFCPKVLTQGSNPTELEGEVIKCLKVKFVIKVSCHHMFVLHSGYRCSFASQGLKADVFHLSLLICGNVFFILCVARNKIIKIIIIKFRLNLWGHEFRSTSQKNH